MKQLILASTSPRRKEILKLSGYDFSVVSPDCEESIPETTPEEYVMELSRRKALAAGALLEHAVVIGADTVVSLDRILGKPSNKEDARCMLKKLSGQVHTVYTGVTILDCDTHFTRSFYEATEVEFYPLAEEEIDAYIRTGEPMDKAGAYGIQGRGAVLVKRINGDYYNVVGLPLAHLMQVLKEFL